MHTWSCKNHHITAMGSQESSSGHAPGGSVLWELLSTMKPGQQPDPCPVCSTEIQEGWKVHLILHVDGPEAGCRIWQSPCPMSATTTAWEAKVVSCWLLQDSSFLPVSSVIQRKASTVIFAQWTRAGFTIHYLATTFKNCLERTICLQVFCPIIPHHYTCPCTLLSVTTIQVLFLLLRT